LERAGTLARLRRYAVKGMAGEDLSEARVTFAGLTGDRVYAFIDENNTSSFPWMTARQAREWLLFAPQFLDPPQAAEDLPCAERYAAEVVTPEGARLAIDGALTEFLGQRFGRSLRLRFSEHSMTDAAPVSLFGLATVRRLSEETAIELDPLRFRANFYVRWERDKPFFEDELVGRAVRIGETVTLQIVKKDGRCVVVTLDPSTAARSPIVLERVAREHGGCAGVYGAVLREGVVRNGDPVYLV
jgi:uncharacterized protein